MKRRFAMPALITGLVLTAATVSAATLTDSVSVGSSNIEEYSQGSVSANSLKPADCNGVSVAQVIGPSGSAGAINSLILAASGTASLTGGTGDDCIIGSPATATIDGGDGNDVCLGNSLASFLNCEAVIFNS